MAITWRTMNQPIAAGVGQLLYGAQQGLNQGFGALQKVLDQHNQTQQANWVNEKKNNTTDYLDAVQNIQDPAQLQDPATQANLAALRQQFGYQVDANAIRGATEKRASDLQVQATNNLKFADLNQEHDQRPLVEEFYRLKNNGDFKGAQGLLDANGFLNEGALSDSLKAGQYKAADESRAVAGEGRAQASFALNQQVGKANLAWTTEQRNRLRDEIRREDTGNNLFTQTVSNYEASRAAEAEKANSIALDYGFKVENGVPVIPEDASQEVRDNLAKDLEAAGVGQVKSPTVMRKELETQLRQAGLKPTEINQQMAAFEATVNRNNTLNVTDQAELDTQQAAVASAATTATEMEKKRWADEVKQNQFLQGIEDPNMTAEDVAKSLKGAEFDPLFFKGTNRDQVIEAAMGVINKGITVDGINYQVPPQMLKAAILMGGNDWTDPGDGVTESLQSFIRANPQGYAASIGALDAHKKNLREINTAAIKQSSQLDTQVRAKSGIPYNTEKFLKTLKKERN